MNTFTDGDLIIHLQNFICALKNNLDDPKFLEYVLLGCADDIDQLCPHIKRESIIERRFKAIQVSDNVREWADQCGELGNIDDNGYINSDICHLHTDYYDWCSFEKEYDEKDIVDDVALYKMLWSMGFKIHM
jgi:hypothetical protein